MYCQTQEIDAGGKYFRMPIALYTLQTERQSLDSVSRMFYLFQAMVQQRGWISEGGWKQGLKIIVETSFKWHDF